MTSGCSVRVRQFPSRRGESGALETLEGPEDGAARAVLILPNARILPLLFSFRWRVTGELSAFVQCHGLGPSLRLPTGRMTLVPGGGGLASLGLADLGWERRRRRRRRMRSRKTWHRGAKTMLRMEELKNVARNPSDAVPCVPYRASWHSTSTFNRWLRRIVGCVGCSGSGQGQGGQGGLAR